MTFISYSENFEDVLVWRALNTVGSGFYVDLGAGHPERSSVTKALYDRGWRGINVEPDEATARLLRAARPRDTTFHAPPDSPVWQAHAEGPVHLMRVRAVEASRAPSIAAAIDRLRPWLLIVASERDPGDGGAWERQVAAAGYHSVWFDGFNHFLVPDERMATMARHFRVPVNSADDFIHVADTAWAVKVGRAEALAADAARRAEAAEERGTRLALGMARQAALYAELERQYRERTAERHSLARHVHQVTGQAIGLVAEVTRLSEAGARAAGERDRIAAERDRLQQETRWRAGPLRLGWSARHAPAEAPEAVAAPVVAVPPLPDGIAHEPLPFDRRFGREIRAVHQYHPDSSTGDAITASMLLIRRVLRRAGFDSHIYVTNRDPALRDELRLLDEIPDHSDYILLLQHSMGQRALERVLSLPVAKILIYHNITPPQHLASASLREAALVGRTQLAQLRDHVAAALADSEYNALELRALGFEPVRTCPLLVDVAALSRPPRDRREQPFTVLFVGRITESKGQLELIESFGHFLRQHGSGRLVLVGRDGGPGDPYAAALLACIRRNGLTTQVRLTGPVPDAERDALYAEADLYVSLSAHEGFGVPLVEAMARGVPVLARPAGAVAETLGQAGELLEDCEPTLVAARMLALARDPARLAAMRAAGLRAVERFTLERTVPRLLEVLARAGAALPADPASRAALVAEMRFAVAGPVGGTGGAGGANRHLAGCLEAARSGRVRVLPVEGAPIEDLAGVPEAERGAMMRLAGREAPGTGAEIVVSQHEPFYRPPNGGDLALALVLRGSTPLQPADVAALAGFGGVLAPSRAVAKALVDSGVTAPVRLLPYAPPLEAFLRLGAGRTASPEGHQVFLYAGGPAAEVVLAAFGMAFDRDDAVELVIADASDTVARSVARFSRAHPRNPSVRVVSGEDRVALLAAAHVVVLPDGEDGFNAGAAEALAAGVPLIVLGHGGHLDFCGAGEARLVEWRHAPAGGAAAPYGLTPEPEADDLVAALREVAADPAGAAARAERGRLRVMRHLVPGRMADALEGVAAELLLSPALRPVRVAWVSSWAIRCGVAEYSRQVLAHLGLGTVTVLADDRPPELGEGAGAGMRVRQAWRAGEGFRVDALMRALRVADADVTCIQHQPGLIPWTVLAAILRRGAAAGPIAVTLHNTRHLSLIEAEDRAEAVAGLRLAARILVHTVDDLNALKRLGLVETVALLPHGTPLARAPRPVGARGRQEPVLIGSFGFLLPDKGLPQLIRAVALLRQTWPQARLRLVCALYSAAHVSAVELHACRAVIAEAGLDSCVELVTDFLPLERSLDLLADCDLVVLPYQFSIEASSAALRVAMASGVPVAVTPLPIFDEAGDAVARLGGVAPDQIAEGLDRLLGDASARAALAEAARSWVGARSWDVVGRRLGGILTRLASDPATSSCPEP